MGDRGHQMAISTSYKVDLFGDNSNKDSLDAIYYLTDMS